MGGQNQGGLIEHDNRKKAKKLAEYITGTALRRYVADKVRQYCGKEALSVFDGAAGSGQLAEYLELSALTAVEIQAESVAALRGNYPQARIFHGSFFQFSSDCLADCVVMNPPFSLKFKELPDADQIAVRRLFPWKKSGVTDDVFALKALRHTRRFAFFILPAGLSYRGTDARFRECLGNTVAEQNLIEHGFEDTAVSVMFLVVDKEKTEAQRHKEIYDCKLEKVLHTETGTGWAMPVLPPMPQEPVDIGAVNAGLDAQMLAALSNHLDSQLFLIQTFGANIDYQGFIGKVRAVCGQYEEAYERIRFPSAA